MFLYPLAITLILLALAGKWFDNDRRIYLCVTIFTLAAAILDFIHALPGETVFRFASKWNPDGSCQSSAPFLSGTWVGLSCRRRIDRRPHLALFCAKRSGALIGAPSSYFFSSSSQSLIFFSYPISVG